MSHCCRHAYSEEAILPTVGTLSKVVVGDCDNDGRNEISTGDVLGSPNKESVYKYPINHQPICTITSPLNGSTVEDVITISGTAFDLDNNVQGVLVKVGDDEWVEASLTRNNTKEMWSAIWNTTLVDDGLYTIYAGSHDGQRYSLLAKIIVNVQNQNMPPIANFSYHPQNPTVNNMTLFIDNSSSQILN